MIRVLVVDDHDIVRDALASLLGDVQDLQVVGVASSIRDALPLLDSARPDIVLCDLQLPVLDGYEVLSEIRKNPARGDTIVIAVTAFSMTSALAWRKACDSARNPSRHSSRPAMRRSSTSADCSPRTWVASQASTYISVQDCA